MSDKNDNLFNALELAFKEANELLTLKNKVEYSISEISVMLRKMTDQKAFLRTEPGSELNYSATDFIYIVVDGGIFENEKILLCGLTIDEVKGFPVQIETAKQINICSNPDELKGFLVKLISKPEVTTQVLTSINNRVDDIPF